LTFKKEQDASGEEDIVLFTSKYYRSGFNCACSLQSCLHFVYCILIIMRTIAKKQYSHSHG